MFVLFFVCRWNGLLQTHILVFNSTFLTFALISVFGFVQTRKSARDAAWFDFFLHVSFSVSVCNECLAACVISTYGNVLSNGFAAMHLARNALYFAFTTTVADNNHSWQEFFIWEACWVFRKEEKNLVVITAVVEKTNPGFTFQLKTSLCFRYTCRFQVWHYTLIFMKSGASKSLRFFNIH